MPKTPSTNIGMRLLTSTSVLLLAMLVAAEVFARVSNPIPALDSDGITRQSNYFVSKLPTLMKARENKDVLLIGASGLLFPSVRCDDKLAGQKIRWDKWYYSKHIFTYSHANYLEHVLSQDCGKPVTVCNAAVAASCVWDHYLVARKYLLSGKKPELAIVCLAPRDFLDNEHTELDKSFTYGALSDVASVPELLRSQADVLSALPKLINLVSMFYHDRSDYHTLITAAAARLTGHPATLAQSASSEHNGGPANNDKSRGPAAPDSVTAHILPDNYVNKLEDLSGYKKMYLPVNANQFQTQSRYLDKLLSLLQENKIPILVVNLPVTAENYALLPHQTLVDYSAMLQKACAKHGLPLYSPAGDTEFDTATDFEDSAHMNENGGEKLFNGIAKAVAREPALLSAISGANDHSTAAATAAGRRTASVRAGMPPN